MKQTKKRLRLILGFSLVLILACSLVMSGMFARYQTEMIMANRVDYTNQLAESFRLLDKPAEIQEDGSYKVDDSAGAVPTDGFSYKLIPGVTLTAAPYVEIVGKTEIPAYLYIEIKNTGGVELTLDDHWTLLSGAAGKKGGTVYSYGDDALTGDGSADPPETLTMPTFTVNKLGKIPMEGDGGEINVYAYMVQKTEQQSAEEAFRSAPQP